MRAFLKVFPVLFIFIFYVGCSSREDDIIVETPKENLYFPPNQGDVWESVSVSSLGWNQNALQPLFDYLEAKETEAFIILKNGRIVIEAYFNGGNAGKNYPWFSAGKTLTAFMTGIAQQEGFLNLNDTSSDYLGVGWSSLNEENESKIKIRNHLTMTTGLDYNVNNLNCTEPECLNFLNAPGTFWFYHNAPYTLIQDIIEGATGQDFSIYFNTKLRDLTGMDGAWVPFNYNKFYFSTARSMARFGILNLNKGQWKETEILKDNQYFTEMTSSSQNLNEAYGYLWWLNGKQSYRLPGSTAQFEGKLIPAAPNDLIAGLGANDQKLYIVPSKGLVIVRLGGDPGESLLGPSGFDSALWEKLNDLFN